MRNMTTVAKSCTQYAVFFIITTFFLGCTSLDKGYFIKPYYKLNSKNEQSRAKGFGTIHINAIEFDKPDLDNHWETFPIRLIKIYIPVLSAIPLADLTAKNSTFYALSGTTYYVIPQEGEMEEILVYEMKNTGMFSEVGSQGIQGDYDVKGRVNFTIESYFHEAGLGIFYPLLIWPTFVLPTAADHYTCEAHFEVISTKDNKVVLSKDYRIEADKSIGFWPWWQGPYDYNIARKGADNRVIGQEIFPSIVKEFIHDLESYMGENAPQISYKPAEEKQPDPDPEIKQEYREIGTDGQFIAYDNGIVYDGHTGLEWYAGPDQDTNWDEADQWVKSLTIAGGGWRMPTILELKSLFIEGAGENNMPPLLKTDDFYFWSGEKKGSRKAWGFRAYENVLEWWDTNESGDVRGLAVRSR